jgi:ribosome-associated heat shock protein Hsp15
LSDQPAIRLDKWLWAARFFKHRSLAQEAVQGGKVQVDGARTKPSKPVRVGQTVSIQKGETLFTVVVAALSDKRGPAEAAAKLYEETAESAETRRLQAEERRERAEAKARRPKWKDDKKKHRQIRKLLGRW